MTMSRFTLLLTLLSSGTLVAQPSEPDWSRLEDETLWHFRALLQFDTSDEIRKVVDDPTVEVKRGERNTRPPGEARLDTEAFAAIEAGIEKHYGVITLPSMSTGATDMAYLRDKGIQCYGIGPAIDVEDGPQGFGAHSDQERILVSELHRFVRFKWDVVTALAAAK